MRQAVWDMLEAQRGALFLWIPLCLGVGIALYFGLPTEPPRPVWIGLGALLSVGAVMVIRGWRSPIVMGVLLIGAGFGLSGLRTATIAAPVMEWRYYGAVQGRIVAVDRSASDKPRLTLDRVVLERMDPDETPARVRVSLHGDQRWLDPVPGQTVIVTAHLSAPEGPVEPGGFDFRRMAFFDQLGGVGYARTPALLLEPPTGALPVQRVRAAVGERVREVLPGQTGTFAAAITTGDRSGIDPEVMAALRASNLAHLLAISGLHMGLMTGVVFTALRIALVLSPRTGLAWPTKSVAAAGALLAGAAYLALSGNTVATQRAFLMAAVMLGAVMLGRRAVTLRSVAIAAILILCIRPEAMAEPGFQMSFAATTALVAGFAALRGKTWLPRKGPAGFLASLLISSFVAGAATAPFGAAHFNQVSQYGLLANLISVPVMGALVMPAAVLAAALAPFGLEAVGLYLMAPGIDWILGVAMRVGTWPGAAFALPSPGPWALPAFAVGALLVVVLRGRLRWIGAGPLALSLALWVTATRPALLIDPTGTLAGIMTSEGRSLSKPKGAGFAAQVWLENDGDTVDQPTAAERPGWTDDVAVLGGVEVHHVYGRDNAARAAAACRPGRIVITTAELPGPADCTLFDTTRLARSGSVAINETKDGLAVIREADTSGRRMWTGPLAPQEDASEPEPTLLARAQ